MTYSREKIMQVVGEIIAESSSIAPYVVVAQPRRNLDETPAQHLDGALGLHVDFGGFSHAFVHIGGEKVDVARNFLIDACLETNARYMLFVGEDTVLPFDGFTKLHATAEAHPGSIVCGVYYIKLSSPMVMLRTDDNHVIPADVTPGRLIHNVHLIGMDAMLIPLDTLRKLRDPELPWCCIYNDQSVAAGFIGEDNFFTYRMRQAGVDIICDTDVQCLHMDLESGKYTAHPGVDLSKYYTNIPLAGELTFADKRHIDQRYIERIPEGSK